MDQTPFKDTAEQDSERKDIRQQNNFRGPTDNREVPGYDFLCQNPYGRYGFFCSIRLFGTENPCGLAFIRTMFHTEILRHRVQKDFLRNIDFPREVLI